MKRKKKKNSKERNKMNESLLVQWFAQSLLKWVAVGSNPSDGGSFITMFIRYWVNTILMGNWPH